MSQVGITLTVDTLFGDDSVATAGESDNMRAKGYL